MRASASAIGVLLGAALIASACGGSTATTAPSPRPSGGLAASSGPTAASSAAAPTAAATEPTATDATDAPTDGGGNSSGSDVIQRDIPPIVDGGWNTGKIYIEITGDRSETFDAPGGGAGMGGVALLTFSNGSDSAFSASVSGTEQTGFSLTTPTVIVGGTWGKECQIKITRNEAAGIAGEFTCVNAEGANRPVTQALRLNLKGTFSATP